MILNLFTFCVDIGRHRRDNLQKFLVLLLNSLHANVSEYNLVCYTNFKINDEIMNNYNIQTRTYYDKEEFKLYNDKWKNLSFNKINIYKALFYSRVPAHEK